MSNEGQGKSRNLGDVLQEFSQHRWVMQQELQKVIVGQDEVIEQVFAAIFTRGHCLLEGVPGLAKTLLVSARSRAASTSTYSRIQFTPDLMPAGHHRHQRAGGRPTPGAREFRFVEGPIFTNVLLADEINRTPPKTQAALLQAMQEREVTVGQTTYDLPEPVLCDRHAEPDRAGGHVPAARGAARPVHVQHPLVALPNLRDEEVESRSAATTSGAQSPEVEQGALRTKRSIQLAGSWSAQRRR